MRWLLITAIYLRVFITTLTYPEKMTPKQKKKTVDLIKKLGELQGLNTSISARHPFSLESLSKVPRERGVYHFYKGHILKYIGASCADLQRRLRQHWQIAHHPSQNSNQALVNLIASDEVFIDWYECPFAGWMEDFELTEHAYPENLLNQQKRGNLVTRCPW